MFLMGHLLNTVMKLMQHRMFFALELNCAACNSKSDNLIDKDQRPHCARQLIINKNIRLLKIVGLADKKCRRQILILSQLVG